VFYAGLILANDVVHGSKEIFDQGASFKWLLPVLLTTLPETLAMVLPMAGVLGGMLGTQYLAEGSEMVASQGLGVGMRSILKPWAILSVVIFGLATANAHLLVPRVSTMQNQLKTQMVEEAKTRHIRPGAPPWSRRGSDGSDISIWVSPNGQIHLMEASGEAVQHVIAKSMNWYRDPNPVKDQSVIIEFEDLSGCGVQGAQHSVVHIQEKTQRLRISSPTPPSILPPTKLRYFQTPVLFTVHTAEAWIELGRRLTLPLSSVALLLLGIGLGLGHPRFYKGGAILKSLGVILVYYILMKFFESRVTDHGKSLIPLLILPFLFLGAGFLLLNRRMRPHRSNRFSLTSWANQKCIHPLKCFFVNKLKRLETIGEPRRKTTSGSSRGVLEKWTRRLWIRQWASVMGSFLLLSLLIEYANVAGDIAKNHISFLVFFDYWVMNLPIFLTSVLPVAFLFSGALTFSEAAQSREWVAIRAGGVSLVQWIRVGFGVWATILLLTFLIESTVAPRVARKANQLYQQIINRPVTPQSSPWLFLGPRNIIWHIRGDEWWGFPLQKPSGGTPILFRWESGNTRTEVVDWDGLSLSPGPVASSLFPEGDLVGSGQIEETSTTKLLLWQKWAPDPARATVIWSRFFNFLAGPALLFALMTFAFPGPREGRGKALGYCMVGGLLFIGIQGIFIGAARVGELPPIWGVLGPILLLVGIGLLRLNRLRT